MIKVKRVYEKPSQEDGTRLLVDRLWPRGVTKKSADIYIWLKEIAPSDNLRQWFSHDPQKWDEFKRRYRKELKEPVKSAILEQVKKLAKEDTITLLFAAKEEEYNNALALKDILAG